MRKQIVSVIVVCGGLLLGLSLCSCSTYYYQSVTGQLAVFSAQQPIAPLLASPDVTLPAAVRDKLTWVLQTRDFATNVLKLPDNDSYRLYADLQRPYVVWSVMAAAELSLTPETWCYPIIGCAVYRGYFDRVAAQAFADTLVAQGLDVSVQGVPAYSTLGWFDDPIFHAVLQWPKAHIAGLIFHELAHAQIYVKGDSAFNESFATAVEIEGVRRWLQASGDESAWQHFQTRKTVKKTFIAFVRTFRQRLSELYAKPMAAPEMRRHKQQIFVDMLAAYEPMKVQWGGFSGYDAWMQQVNNAKMNTVTTYHQYVPAFQVLLAQSGGDLAVFYQHVADVGALDAAVRQQRLQALVSD